MKSTKEDERSKQDESDSDSDSEEFEPVDWNLVIVMVVPLFARILGRQGK